MRRDAVAVFAVTALGSFMAALDLSIVNVAFPDLEASYPHASQASLAWVITPDWFLSTTPEPVTE